MVLGIILIVIGIIGSVITLVIGIKFMKKNNFIFKSEYVEIDNSSKNRRGNVKNEHIPSSEDTQLLDEDSNSDTMLLNDENSLDTELLL